MGCRILSVAALYFPCHFEYLVQFLLVHCLEREGGGGGGGGEREREREHKR